MQTQEYRLHITTLAALFTLGNAVVLTPMLTAKNLSLLIIVFLAVMFFSAFLQRNRLKNKKLFYLLEVMAFVTAVYGAATAFLDYIRFLKSDQMPHTSYPLLIIITAAIVLVLSSAKTHALYKYCLLAFLIVVTIVAVCFVGGIKFFDGKNLIEVFACNKGDTREVLRVLAPIIVLPFFYPREKGVKKLTAVGVAAAILILLATMLQAGLVLGCDTNVTYAYLRSVSIISVGSLFTRLDGIVWFLFFVTSTIKCAVCIKIATKIIHSCVKRFKK